MIYPKIVNNLTTIFNHEFKMEKVLLSLCMLASIAANSQITDFNSIILPTNATDIEFSEKLVRLAWQNNPSVGVLHAEQEQASLGVKYSKWNWLDNFRFTGNLNEFNIDNPNPSDGSQFFPRYNISESISLGTFFTNPIKTKVERQNVIITSNNINQKKLEIRAQVLKLYQAYLSNKEIYDLRTQMLEDAYSDFKLKEQGFSRGGTSLADYSFSLDRYNQQKIFKIQAEREMQISLIELEEVIGIKLSDVR
jgi:outer membrane protein TolC